MSDAQTATPALPKASLTDKEVGAKVAAFDDKICRDGSDRTGVTATFLNDVRTLPADQQVAVFKQMQTGHAAEAGLIQVELFDSDGDGKPDGLSRLLVRNPKPFVDGRDTPETFALKNLPTLLVGKPKDGERVLAAGSAIQPAPSESDNRTPGAEDESEQAIFEGRTKQILSIFATKGNSEKTALAPKQREQLEGLEEAFAGGDVAELGRLMAAINTGDRTAATRVLAAFRTDLFAMGIRNAYSGDAKTGYSLHLHQKEGTRNQILTIDSIGGSSTEDGGPYRKFDRIPGQPLDAGTTLPEVSKMPILTPEQFLKRLRYALPGWEDGEYA